jgi:hypothetical protein
MKPTNELKDKTKIAMVISTAEVKPLTNIFLIIPSNLGMWST